MGKPKIIREIIAPEKAVQIAKGEETYENSRGLLKDELKKRKSFAAPDGTSDVTSAAEQEGRSLMRGEFMRKVRKLNPALFYERSNNHPAQGGIYFNDHAVNPLTLSRPGKRFLVGIVHSKITEFDVRVMGDSKVPDPDVALHWQSAPNLEQHVPGWRSTLLRLVIDGHLELEKVIQEFHIPSGRSSQNWQQAVN
jgi:hypothetical protein